MSLASAHQVPTHISLRAYAKHRGVSVEAVSQAVKGCRLTRSVLRVDGKPKIADVALADEEWTANTDHSKSPQRARRPPARSPVAETVNDPPPPLSTPEAPVPTTSEGMSLSEAAAAEKLWKARQAELDYRRDAGQLVSAVAVTQAWSEMVGEMRAAVLGVPSKLKGARPETTREQLTALESFLCQALEGLTPRRPGVH